MPAGKGKRVLVSISSSSSEEEEEEDEEEEEEEEEEDEEKETDGGDVDSDDEEEEEEADADDGGDDDSDDDGEVDDEDVISVSSSEDVIDEDADYESADDDLDAMLDNKDSCDRIVQLLQGGQDLNVIKLEECKAYLRNHGLRVTGTKSVCIERILEHWRIKDGNGEKQYPRSSFVINCTGDVCKGDVVLFTQRVYKKFDVVSRAGNPIGKRIIAGRVVKESYGEAKQQHTFTVEVLWSKGVKKLPPLFPLLVKGRNLYRLKTFRQRWDDEAERLKVLAEKHRRGAAARQIRAMKKAKYAVRGTKHGKHSCHATLQSKPQKSKAHCRAQNHDTGSSNGPSSREAQANRNSKKRASKLLSSKHKRHSGRTLGTNKRWRKPESAPATAKKTKHNIDKSKASPLMAGGLEIQGRPRASESVSEYLQLVNLQRDELPAFQLAAQNDNSYSHPHVQHQIGIPPVATSMQLHQGCIPHACFFSLGMHPSSSYEVGSTSIGGRLSAGQPALMHIHHPSFNHVQHFSNAGLNSSTWLDPLSDLRTQVGIDRQIHARPPAGHATEPKSNSLICQTPGCKDMGAKSCVGSLCWNCCRRKGWKCSRHKVH